MPRHVNPVPGDRPYHHSVPLLKAAGIRWHPLWGNFFRFQPLLPRRIEWEMQYIRYALYKQRNVGLSVTEKWKVKANKSSDPFFILLSNPKTQWGEWNFEEVAGDYSMEMEVTGSFPSSLFFTPQPCPSRWIKRQLRELWQVSLFQGRAKQPSLFCQLPLQGSCWLHFAQYVCEYLIFTEDKKGKSSGIQ